jgi:hypothetical protein
MLEMDGVHTETRATLAGYLRGLVIESRRNLRRIKLATGRETGSAASCRPAQEERHARVGGKE